MKLLNSYDFSFQKVILKESLLSKSETKKNQQFKPQKIYFLSGTFYKFCYGIIVN